MAKPGRFLSRVCGEAWKAKINDRKTFLGLKGGESMSKGHCGYAHLVASDETLLLYSYCAYDLNRADWQEMKKKEDGEIAIDRDSLIEPEVHEKVKRLPSGKRTTVVKRIEREVPYEDLLKAKKIRIQNASGAWDFSETGIDEVALKIVHIIFSEYQKTGNIPDYPTWYV